MLEAPDDSGRFHIERRGGNDMGEAGRLDPDGTHGLVDIAWVRQEAEGRVGPDWHREFDAMLAYATSKGWLVGDAIKAHVEP